MKDICFIAPKAYQLFDQAVLSTFGGAEVQVVSLARELARSDAVRVHFMVADYGQPVSQGVHGIRVWNAVPLNRSYWTKASRLISVLRQIRPDVLVQTTLTPYSVILALWCRIQGIRFIYMVMHDGEVDGTTVVPGGLAGRFLGRLTFRLAHTTIVQNTHQAASIQTRTTLIPPGIALSSGTVHERRDILWVGRSEHWKRPELFLWLAQQFPQERFVMLCPPATANPELAKQIRMRADQISNLTFHGFVPFEQARHYYEQARVFVNTSTQEGFPTTFLQAGAIGVPVVSLRVDPSEMLSQRRCGFACGDDRDELVRNLERLVSDEHLYATCSTNIRQYVTTHHDAVRSAEAFLRVVMA